MTILGWQRWPKPKFLLIFWQVFSKEWHKIHFGVFRDRVVLYINCQPVGERNIDVVDSRIDLSGEIMVAKEAESSK